jgi:hypothetical protein
MVSCNCNCNGKQLRVGDTLYGFAGGMFGSSSYGPRLVIHVAPDWVVYQERGHYNLWEGDPQRLLEYTDPQLEDDS